MAHKTLGKRKATKPANGHTFNPAKKYPRNSPCFCGSNEKFKNCCDPFLSHFIEDDNALKIEKALKDGARLCITRHARAKLEEERQQDKQQKGEGIDRGMA